MDKNNPAVFECRKSKNTLHHWVRDPDSARATCLHCKVTLTNEQTEDCYRDFFTR